VAAAKFVDAPTAAADLGVKRETLYAYVSRGLVRTAPSPGLARERLYAVSDIASLVRKRQLRRPSRAVAEALNFGLPVLETRVSSIANGVLRYRGVDAIDIARSMQFEDVAKLLWDLDAKADAPRFRFLASDPNEWDERARQVRGLDATERALYLLPLFLRSDDSGLRRGSAAEVAANLVGAIAKAAAGCNAFAGEPLHLALSRHWRKPAAADAIRCALVVSADHELNASTFAVRVVASTGASLTASLLAGVAALSGPRHGGMTLRVERLLAEIDSPRKARGVVGQRLRSGENIAGFHHPLYPEGDPRARSLLAYCKNDEQVLALCKAVDAMAGLQPSLDVGLVAIEREFRLPRGTALSLFAIGRSVGWIAHAIEQRESAQLIRPRARFAG
jgi:citrate synthase